MNQINYFTSKKSTGIKYMTPVKITTTQTYYANAVKNGKLVSNITQSFHLNKATGKKITLINQPSTKYAGDGAFTLVNGVQNEKGLARSKEFLGFEGTDCEAVIDLGKSTEIKEVIAHTFEENGSWIYRPKSIEVLVSDDGINFQSAGKSDMFIEVYPLRKVGVSFTALQTRFIKVLIKNFGTIPAGNPGGGHSPWLFLDEIEVN
ncbi:MAG: hypothetical protein HYX40_07120 [Sphingobacteriales bacterium]|nr:hypothetical protein [Sphingobacteriales bacterium]